MVTVTGDTERLTLKFLTKSTPIDPMNITLGEGLHWEVGATGASALSKDDALILAVRQKGQATAKELEDHLGISRRSVNSSIASLKGADRIAVVDKRGTAPVYAEKTERGDYQAPLSKPAMEGMHRNSEGTD